MTEPTQAEAPHEHIWLMRIFITFGMTMMVLPCIFCWWIYMGRTELFKFTLPIYPRAKQISEAYAVYGASSALQTLYYWTPDAVDNVKEYYETFTLPFIQQSYGFTWEADQHYRTAFHPYGQPLPIVTSEFGRDIINPAESRRCYYKMRYECVEIELIDFEPDTPVALRPSPRPMRMLVTEQPPSSELRGGTLIVYMYYVYDF